MADEGSQLRGFFASSWAFRNKVLWSWDALAALLVLAAVVAFPTDEQIMELAPGLAGAALGLGAAMVGVVVAGLAVVVALLDDKLLRLIDKDEKSGRVPGHLFPYWFVTGTGVAAFLLALFLLLANEAMGTTVLRVATAVTAAATVWTAFGIFNLVASLQALGIIRAQSVREE